MQLLIEQIRILETMSPQDFLEFRYIAIAIYVNLNSYNIDAIIQFIEADYFLHQDSKAINSEFWNIDLGSMK